MHITTVSHRLILVITGACGLALAPWQAMAQQVYGKVIDATPIYEEVALPIQECAALAQYKRCENTTSYEEKLVGYDVLYEYSGRQYTQRMPHHPGTRVLVEPDATNTSYGSKNRTNTSIATPGSKSYGSVPAGATNVESIEYQANDLEPLLNLDMPLVTRPYRPR